MAGQSLEFEWYKFLLTGVDDVRLTGSQLLNILSLLFSWTFTTSVRGFLSVP